MQGTNGDDQHGREYAKALLRQGVYITSRSVLSNPEAKRAAKLFEAVGAEPDQDAVRAYLQAVRAARSHCGGLKQKGIAPIVSSMVAGGYLVEVSAPATPGKQQAGDASRPKAGSKSRVLAVRWPKFEASAESVGIPADVVARWTKHLGKPHLAELAAGAGGSSDVAAAVNLPSAIESSIGEENSDGSDFGTKEFGYRSIHALSQSSLDAILGTIHVLPDCSNHAAVCASLNMSTTHKHSRVWLTMRRWHWRWRSPP